MSEQIPHACRAAAALPPGGAIPALGRPVGGSRRSAALAACVVALTVLGGCSMFRSSPSSSPSAAAPSAANGNGAAQSAVTFPARDSASLKEGTFVNLDNLRQMIPGMTKTQVYDLLGPPHFSEGVFGVRTWNYIFNFRTGNGNEFITCQYQLRFDKEMRTEAGNWNRRECADFVFPRPVAAPPPPAPAPVKPAPRQITLGADALFAFDRSDLASISPEGRRRLDEIGKELRSVDVERVRVIGHADRLGSAAYNDRLSEERASTVVRYLVNAGVPSGQISSEGRGSREPVVQCNQRSRSELIACLAPNRRVVIEIHGKAGTS